MAIHRYLQILDIFHLRSLRGHIVGGDASVTSPWKWLLKPGAARSHQMLRLSPTMRRAWILKMDGFFMCLNSVWNVFTVIQVT